MSKTRIPLVKDDVVQTAFSLFTTQKPTRSEATTSKDQCPIRNLKEDQARFLWLYQCHNFMIKLGDHDNKKAKEEMITCCRQEYKDNQSKSAIDDFNNESIEDNAKNALWWYSQNTFIYKCTNTVLRKENISNVYTYRYIIKLLCCQLKEQHKLFIREYQQSEKKTSIRIYRGAYWKLEDLRLLDGIINDLISLNGFVSATRDKDTAITFIRRKPRDGCVPVLIKIDIDMANEHNVAFADISKFSASPDEREVLLSIGSVFRVKSVSFDDQEQLHIINLSLSHNDQLTVIQYIEQTYAKNVDSADQSVLFGKLLFDMGECESAISYFSDVLDRLSDNNNQMRATYLNNIGVCFNGMGRKDEALKYYKAALRIYQQTNNERGIGACQHNIASIYHAEGDDRKALQYALDAFNVRQSNKIEKAATLDLLGCIHVALIDIEAAGNNFYEALQLRLRYLGQVNPHHPDIGVSYHNLGKINSRNRNFTGAEKNYSRATEIYRHNYPRTHPLVREINDCLKETQRRLKCS